MESWQWLLVSVLACSCTTTLSQPVVTVDACTRMDTSYTVTGGSTSGHTYVETSTNSACVLGIADGTSDSFTVNFADCGVTYTEIDSGRIIEFVIVTQEHAAYNIAEDLRVKVSCSFATGEFSVMDIVVTSSNAPDGTPDRDIPVSVNPVPRMTLYRQDSVTLEYTGVSNEVIELGHPLMLMVELDQELPDYEILVKRCYVQAEMSTVVGSLDVNDGTSHCSIYPSIFNSFVYNYHPPNAFPYATAEFEAFLPTVPSVNLRTDNITIRYLCRVEVCIRGTGCDHPTCTTRKRRESPKAATNGTGRTYTLTSGHRISLVEPTDSLTDLEKPSIINPPDVGTSGVCLNNAESWAVLLSVLFLLIVAIIGICCWFLVVRNSRKRKEDKCSYDRRTMATTTQSTASTKGQLYTLPRFVQASQSPSRGPI